MQEAVKSSGVLTANTAVTGSTKRAALLHSAVIVAAAATATIKVYDNTTNSGTPVVVLSAGANGTTPFELNSPISMDNGIYLEISGAGAQMFCTYSLT